MCVGISFQPQDHGIERIITAKICTQYFILCEEGLSSAGNLIGIAWLGYQYVDAECNIVPFTLNALFFTHPKFIPQKSLAVTIDCNVTTSQYG